VQETVLSAHPRGRHAFRAPVAHAPSLVDDEDDEGGDDEGREGGDVSLAVAINGLQGSINRLIDIVIKSMTTPEDSRVAITRSAQAVERVQDVDDGLSTMEKVELIRQFQENESAAGTYLSLINQPLRQAWIRTKLESVSGGAAT
jgi:hypothetical protein